MSSFTLSLLLSLGLLAGSLLLVCITWLFPALLLIVAVAAVAVGGLWFGTYTMVKLLRGEY